MSVSQVYPFDTSTNYNKTDVDVSGSKAVLAVVPKPSQVFSEDFVDDTGFTHDNTKTEFVAGMLRQKNLLPTDSVLGATYTSLTNASWTRNNLSISGVLVGTPTIIGNKIDLTGGINRSVMYENNDIGLLADTGTVKCKYTPDYSGAPAVNSTIIELKDPLGVNNKITLFHGSTNRFRITVNSSTGAGVHSAYSIGAAFLPVAGTTYEIELNFKASTGVMEVYLDGNLVGATPATTFTRTGTATQLYVGAGTTYAISDAFYEDVVLFDTVQHTASYTPGYSLPENVYDSDTVDLPAFTYSLLGTIQSLDSLAITEVGSPKYTFEGQYYNGSSWVASNGSYAQAIDSATAITNLGSLSVSGETVISVQAVFNSSNIQSSVDNLSLTYTGQRYSAEGYLEPVFPINVKELVGYSQFTVDTANTEVRVILNIDGILTYFDGVNWVISDGSSLQSNTPTDINTNLSTLDFGSNSTVFVRWLLTTTNDDETPELTLCNIMYDFGAIETPLSTCMVYGYYKDVSNQPIVGADVIISLSRLPGEYQEANKNVIEQAIVLQTDVNGYFSQNLIRSSEYATGGTYKLVLRNLKTGLNTSIKNDETSLTFDVPDADQKDITDLLPTI